MKRLNKGVYWFLYFVFLVSTDLNSFFTPVDNFGFYVGAYGIKIPYPLTILGDLIVITSIVLVTYIFSRIFEVVFKEEHLSLLLSFIFGLILYTLLSPVIYAIGILFYGSVFIASIHNTTIVEDETHHSVDNLRYKILIQGLVFTLTTIVTLINYVIWFIRGTEVIVFPTQYMSFLVTKKFAGHRYGFSDYTYGVNIYNATIITFILNSGLVFILTYYLWQRVSHLISELLHSTPVFVLQSSSNSFSYQILNSATGLLSNHKVVSKKHSLEKWVAQIETQAKVFFRTEGGDGHILDLHKVEEVGIQLEDFIKPSVLIHSTSQSEKQPILLFNDMSLPIENIYLRNKHPVTVWHYITPIRFMDVSPNPYSFAWKKRILHLTSSELNSSLMRSKLERYVLDTPHVLVNLRVEEFEERSEEIFSQSWDILLITLHGALDGDGLPYFYGEEGGSCIYPEDLIGKLEMQGIPLVLIASCLSVINYTTLVKPLLESGTLMFTGSTSNVLASHLPLIVLSFLESTLSIRGRLTLSDVYNTTRNCYSTIQKFGFPLQWAFFRTVIPDFQSIDLF